MALHHLGSNVARDTVSHCRATQHRLRRRLLEIARQSEGEEFLAYYPSLSTPFSAVQAELRRLRALLRAPSSRFDRGSALVGSPVHCPPGRQGRAGGTRVRGRGEFALSGDACACACYPPCCAQAKLSARVQDGLSAACLVEGLPVKKLEEVLVEAAKPDAIEIASAIGAEAWERKWDGGDDRAGGNGEEAEDGHLSLFALSMGAADEEEENEEEDEGGDEEEQEDVDEDDEDGNEDVGASNPFAMLAGVQSEDESTCSSDGE